MPPAGISPNKYPMLFKESLNYYTQHSLITNPRQYKSLFDALPHDVTQLVPIVQGLLLHLLWARSYGVTVPAERRPEIYLRTVPEMVGRIMTLDERPLALARPYNKRLVSICRDFATVLVTMLRHKGVPARLRIGFAGYFPSQELPFWDHRIAEYWDEKQAHWIMVDSQIDAVQQAVVQQGNPSFNHLAVNASSPFYVAGEVWQQCRAGNWDAYQFGDSLDDRGMSPIRYALLHDFDALNKMELVGFDAWHTLIDKPEPLLTPDEYAFLDEVAAATIQPDATFQQLQTLYQTSEYGQTVQAELSLRGER